MQRSTIATGRGRSVHHRVGGICTVAPAVLAVFLSAGCRTDPGQQLLERELRMQEDQIYQLQDELQEKCARLDRVAGENTSLRRQLGVSDQDQLPRGRGPSRSAVPGVLPAPRGADPPIFVPPAVTLPPPSSAPSAAPGLRPPATPPGTAPRPGTIAPPALEGVPPLPSEPRFPGAAMPERPGVVPASAAIDIPDAPTAIDASGRPLATGAADGLPDPPLSNAESLAVSGRITHLVVNTARTECFDGDGDGVSEGLAIVFEPRDGDERLVTAAGDVTVAVFDAAADGPPLAAWEIPTAEAAARFRRTSRNRGLHFVLRWPGPPPPGPHARVAVTLTTFDGGRFETDCTVPVGQARGLAAP